MNAILANLCVGVLIMPGVLFLAASLLNGWRQRKGLSQLPPNQVSLAILLLSLVSWAIAGFNILIHLLRN